MTVITSGRGAAIGYDTFGDPDAPALVLIQGFSAQRLGWRPGFCEQLAAAGFHVLRYDNRDVGESERYAAVEYEMDAFALDTVDLLDSLGLASAHIVGQSMGGIIAQYLAEDHASRVRSLGLLYTSASLAHVVGAETVIARTQVTPPTTRDEFIAFYPVSEQACASPAYPQDVAWLADVAGPIWDHGYDPAGIERQLQAMLKFPNRLDAARAITATTAIIAGDSDQLIDYHASLELHEAIAGSTLDIFPGMGHELPQALWPEIVGALTANAERATA